MAGVNIKLYFILCNSPLPNPLFQVKVNGTSKMLSFDDQGEIKNAKYDIVNFVSGDGYFREVGIVNKVNTLSTSTHNST